MGRKKVFQDATWNDVTRDSVSDAHPCAAVTATTNKLTFPHCIKTSIACFCAAKIGGAERKLGERKMLREEQWVLRVACARVCVRQLHYAK